MDTASHVRIEEIRSLVAAKARLDRLATWTLGLCVAASAFMAMGSWLSAAMGGAVNPADAADTAARANPAPWIGVAGLLAVLSALLSLAYYVIRTERLASRFRECLRDPSTREVPPLDGEEIAGLRCVEPTADRTTWSARFHPAWILGIGGLFVICFMMPRDFNRMMTIFGGDAAEGTVGRLGNLRVWMDWITLVLLATFVVTMLRSLSARTITLVRSPGGPRLRVTLAGVRPARTLEIPASAIRANDPRTRATLTYEDPTGGTLRAIPLSPFGGPFTTVGRWQLERLCNDFRRRLGEG